MGSRHKVSTPNKKIYNKQTLPSAKLFFPTVGVCGGQRVVELEKVRYYYFAEGSPPPAAASSVKSTFDKPGLSDFSGGAVREAWLTDEGWPRQTKEGGVIATYTFKSADAIEPITVPEKFHALVQAFLDALSRKDPAYSGNQ
jgi:hypothetical protein